MLKFKRVIKRNKIPVVDPRIMDATSGTIILHIPPPPPPPPYVIYLSYERIRCVCYIPLFCSISPVLNIYPGSNFETRKTAPPPFLGVLTISYIFWKHGHLIFTGSGEYQVPVFWKITAFGNFRPTRSVVKIVKRYIYTPRHFI